MCGKAFAFLHVTCDHNPHSSILLDATLRVDEHASERMPAEVKACTSCLVACSACQLALQYCRAVVLVGGSAATIHSSFISPSTCCGALVTPCNCC